MLFKIWFFDVLLSVLIFAGFGYLGIYLSNKNKFLKKFNIKKNLITMSIIYILLIAIMEKSNVNDTAYALAFACGLFGAGYLGAILARGIITKFKSIFNQNFYHALFATIILGFFLSLIV